MEPVVVRDPAERRPERLTALLAIQGEILEKVLGRDAVDEGIDYDIWIQGDGTGNYDVIWQSTKSGVSCSVLLRAGAQTDCY